MASLSPTLIQRNMEGLRDDGNKNDVMVSNLPLLFADGNPTSLELMSAEDLLYYVPFLIRCIIGVEPESWSTFPRFTWWPRDIPWSPIILSKKHHTEAWRQKLKSLVQSCYDYNGCSYLLHFSSKLQQLKGGFKYADNWDGTMSMYDSTSGKLLVTFRNENMNYDRAFRQQNSSSLRPMLLPPRLNSLSPNKSGSAASSDPLRMVVADAPPTAQMVESPPCDIFLCDYCGADFNKLSAIKAHESKCAANQITETMAGSSVVEPEADLDQAKFLWYLSLGDRTQQRPPPNVTPAKACPFRKKVYSLNDRRCHIIPFSSNLAQSFKISKLSMTSAEGLVDRYEKNCPAKPRTGKGPFRAAQMIPVQGEANIVKSCQTWQVTYRRLPGQRRKEEWSHSYCFSKYERRERLKTIATGLTKQARSLFMQCRKSFVVLSKLKPEVIEKWTRPRPKNRVQQSMFHPSVQRSLASLPPTCTYTLAPQDCQPSALSPARKPSLSLVITRPDVRRRSTGGAALVKPRPRSPPLLVPLITNAWSLKTPSVEPISNKQKNQFILPDLIPVNRSSMAASSEPVAVRSPNTSSASSRPSVVVVDLCSDDEEEARRKGKKGRDLHVSEYEVVKGKFPPSYVLPPGISITKVTGSSDKVDELNKSNNTVGNDKVKKTHVKESQLKESGAKKSSAREMAPKENVARNSQSKDRRAHVLPKEGKDRPVKPAHVAKHASKDDLLKIAAADASAKLERSKLIKDQRQKSGSTENLVKKQQLKDTVSKNAQSKPSTSNDVLLKMPATKDSAPKVPPAKLSQPKAPLKNDSQTKTPAQKSHPSKSATFKYLPQKSPAKKSSQPKTPTGKDPLASPRVQPKELPENDSEKNNNRSKVSSPSLVEKSTSSSIVEPLPLIIKSEQTPCSDQSYDVSPDEVLPIVVPLKLAKLPAAKREQMKQSLLKIQQQEGMSPPPSTLNNSKDADKETCALLESDLLLRSPKTPPASGAAQSVSHELSKILSDECKELKQRGLGDLLFSNERVTRRKRTQADRSPIEADMPNSKMIKLDPAEDATKDAEESADEYLSIIEVDVSEPSRDPTDGEVLRSFRSPTPDDRTKKRNSKELSKLMRDECKELRSKGLEYLTHSDQRVTRCRTKSLPDLPGKSSIVFNR